MDLLQQLNYHHLYYFWMVAREGSVVAASEQLGLSQPTVSTQMRKLEKTLGRKLLDRVGRGLVLTDAGQAVFEYAEDIFALGRELVGAVHGVLNDESQTLRIGAPDVMPKLITFQLLRPIVDIDRPFRMVFRQAQLTELVAELAAHRLDVILSDSPLGADMHAQAYNHLLGECSVAICGEQTLARKFVDGFPASLNDAPILLPSINTELRRSLDQWYARNQFRRKVVAEFEDSALMKEFGHGGLGLFPVPSAALENVKRQYGVELVGVLEDVRSQFYAITPERRLKHPAVVAISESARCRMFAEPTPTDGQG